MHEIRYCAALDGLRAICIVFTLMNHVDGTPPFIIASAGVDVFFALSGFLITGILLTNDWRDLKGYYIRRFFRIAPVYYLALFITVALALLVVHDVAGTPKYEQVHDMFIPSLLISREWSTAPTLFGQAWTVGIEEKFYLIWPILFLLLRDDRLRIAVLLLVILAFAHIGDTNSLRGYGGIALGCISSIGYFRRGLNARISVAIAVVTAAYVFALLSDFWFRNLAISFASAILVPSLYARSSLLSRLLQRPAIVTLGKLTFSIYMFHVLVFNAVKVLLGHFEIQNWTAVFSLGYLMTICFSWIVYTYFEAPLIRYGKRLSVQA